MARIACDLSDFLLAVRLKLVTDGVFTDPQCYLSLDPDEIMATSPSASPLCGLTFLAFDQRPDTISCESDNDENPTMEGELVCSVWIRVNLDAPGRDTQLLTNQTLGATQLVRRLFKSLQNASIYDPQGSELTWRTLTFLGARNRGRWKREPAWRRIDVRFNSTFEWLSANSQPMIWNDAEADTILSDDSTELSYT